MRCSILCVITIVALLFSACSTDEPENPVITDSEQTDNENNGGNNDGDSDKIEQSMIRITIGSNVFDASLADTEAAEAFRKMLPLKLDMSELNGNEKYFYLANSLPSQPSRIGNIKSGDIVLWGSDCFVIFYKSFSTTYSYTRIGHINNPDGLADAVGKGNVTIMIEIL